MSLNFVLAFLLGALVCTATARNLGSSAVNDEKTVIITDDGGGIGEGIGGRVIGEGIGGGVIGDGIGHRIIGDGIGEGIREEGGYRWESGVREGNGIIGGGIIP